MLVYAWTADPDSGTFAGADAASTSWTAPAATRDAQVVVLTLTVTDDGAGSLQGFDTVTFTVRPLDTEDLDDARSAPSFMSRHEGIQAGPLRDELQWLFPRRVPYTDYAAIGFDGFEVQSRARGPGEDWNCAGCCWRGWPPTTSSGRPRPESASRSRPRPTAGTASGGCGRCTRPLRASPRLRKQRLAVRRRLQPAPRQPDTAHPPHRRRQHLDDAPRRRRLRAPARLGPRRAAQRPIVRGRHRLQLRGGAPLHHRQVLGLRRTPSSRRGPPLGPPTRTIRQPGWWDDW